ncbi:MAG: hypothetical protein JXX28_01945 [Deltaproteobacteria bacterium]|nr:hypothetical protein [Deltaproteobacteria bacterium]
MTRHITLWLTATLLQGCAYLAEGTSGWYVLDEDRRCWEYEEVGYRGAWWHRYARDRCPTESAEHFFSDENGRCILMDLDCAVRSPHDSPIVLPCTASTCAGCCEDHGWGGCM